MSQYPADDLFAQQTHTAIDEVLAEVVTEAVFDGSTDDYRAWIESPPDVMRLVWEAKTERRKLSVVAEEFFRRLALRLGGSLLLKKGELHRLVPYATVTGAAETEIRAKLDLMAALFQRARPHGEQVVAAADESEGNGNGTGPAPHARA